MKNFLFGLLLFFMQTSIIVLLFALNMLIYFPFIIVVMAVVLFVFTLLLTKYLYSSAKGNIVPVIISFVAFVLFSVIAVVVFPYEDFGMIVCAYLNFWLNVLPNGACIIMLLIDRAKNKIKSIENEYGRRK
ncbi:MAG: hypothetical protein IJN65_01075 [Clostridia bacterium]|nr:hypothetical protein [Clostridia bacterium]